ncbi:MAG: leucyl aminopeptidase [Acidimicrobiales bacterium]
MTGAAELIPPTPPRSTVPTIVYTAAAATPKGVELLAVPVPSDRIGQDLAVPDGLLATGRRGGGRRRSGDPVAVPWSHLERTGFTAKAGEVALLPSAVGGDGEAGAATIAYVGVGPADAVTTAVLRKAAGSLGRAARKFSSVAVGLLAVAPEGIDDAEALGAVVEGVALGAYAYTAQRSKAPDDRLASVVVVGSPLASKPATAVIARAEAVVAGVALARDLVNEPGGSLTPAAFAERARAVAAEADGVAVTVHDEAAIEALGLGGLVAVNRGSTLPARFVELSYTPAKVKRGTAAVALVGKGITYDSGGLSLKSHEGLTTMKCDMAGAAAVLGAFSAMAGAGVAVPVKGYLPLTDNMPGGDATRVGDVIRHVDGSTTEVLNTDAEGRLVLADALAVATGKAAVKGGRKPKAVDAPAAVVDLATLTGAAIVALGAKIAAVLGNDEAWITQVRAAADRAGEPLWPLPLRDEERPLLDSKVADRKNIGNRHGGALTAGLFLRDFVADGVPWAHLDIAGPAFNEGSDDGEVPTGGTGYGVRTLLALLSTFEAPPPADP